MIASFPPDFALDNFFLILRIFSIISSSTIVWRFVG